METLIRQLRQRVRVPLIDVDSWFDSQFPSLESQQKVLDQICLVSESNPYYAQRVVKTIIEKLERHMDADSVILDGYYEKLFEVMRASPSVPTDTDVLGYTLQADSEDPDKDKVVLIKESPDLISGMGTTGLRTWEASLFLSQWLLRDFRSSGSLTRKSFEGKTILELGCGTGFVGICLYKYFRDQMKGLIFTDGDTQLIDRISANLLLNDISIDSGDLKVCKLWWGEDDLPPIKIDTIVAADVTYDASVIPDLAGILAEAMSQDNGEYGRVDTAYIAATVRNPSTIEAWEEYLDNGQHDRIWDWQIIDSTENGKYLERNRWDCIWYPVGVAQIKIYEIRRVIDNLD
ncbi:DEKNAAC100240 [Brettanomyces naardenensis]|uniref:DEKNAAC100240 n=1 Tax=Brettanomyces naardenensis TaxID=13370 RepID=A0A448YEC6_BRENA|nr:DEKNAAC100240 [Brettanomyces naardenensis]